MYTCTRCDEDYMVHSFPDRMNLKNEDRWVCVVCRSDDDASLWEDLEGMDGLDAYNGILHILAGHEWYTYPDGLDDTLDIDLERMYLYLLRYADSQDEVDEFPNLRGGLVDMREPSTCARCDTTANVVDGLCPICRMFGSDPSFPDVREESSRLDRIEKDIKDTRKEFDDYDQDVWRTIISLRSRIGKLESPWWKFWS